MDSMIKHSKTQQIDSAVASDAKIYLLDRGFGIICAHTCGENDEKVDDGTSFFDLFAAGRAVREEIAAYVRSHPADVLLTLCGSTPVLFVGTLAAHTGLVLAIVPEGNVKKTLAFPAGFHRVPVRVCVGKSAQMRYKAHREADFAAAAQWLLALSAPFSVAQDSWRTLDGPLTFCATRLGALWRVPLSCDFSGVSAVTCTGIHFPFAVGVMLAAVAAARNTATEEGVRLYAAMEGAPALYLEYTRTALSDTVPEFLPLLACAEARGAVLDVVFPKEDPCRVQIRACIGIVELSAQGVRERHRFLEGKSPLCALPRQCTCVMPFDELSFDP